jgi:hypothetical protein
LSSPAAQPPVFCAVVDRAYFLGAVALVNSLRLTGHSGDIAFLDVGLEPGQRALLEQEASIHEGPANIGWLSVFVKPILGLMFPSRTAVLLDNDVVITGSLDPLVDDAERGAIVVFEQPDSTRWFAEWEDLFSLERPLRRGRYVNGACVALSTSHWQRFLERWHALGEVVAAERADRPFLLRPEDVVADPVGYNEQDTLNALLLSEVPESAISFRSHQLTPWWEERREVRVVDSQTLECELGGQKTLFLHSTGQPKPWQRWGWLRLRFSAFNQLLTRVLTGDDIPLRVPIEAIPMWLRPGSGSRVLEHSGAGAARVANASISVLPMQLRTRVTGAGRAKLSRTGARA